VRGDGVSRGCVHHAGCLVVNSMAELAPATRRAVAAAPSQDYQRRWRALREATLTALRVMAQAGADRAARGSGVP
jgi:hypothetical protein